MCTLPWIANFVMLVQAPSDEVFAQVRTIFIGHHSGKLLTIGHHLGKLLTRQVFSCNKPSIVSERALAICVCPHA